MEKQLECMNNLYNKFYEQSLVSQLSPITNKINKIDELRVKLMTSMSFKTLNKVEVRKSNIHGNGVFAKQDIKKNEIVTFYPVDILQLYLSDDEQIGFFSDRYLKKFGKDINRSNLYKYSCNNKNIILGEPSFIDNNNYIGHIINDVATHDKTKSSIKKYKKLSNKANCGFYNLLEYNELCIPVIVEKDIKKDEELLISYGVPYWNNI